MFVTYEALLEVDSVGSEHSMTIPVPAIVPQSPSRLKPYKLGEEMSQSVEYESLLQAPYLQANWCAVSVTSLDSGADVQLKVDIEYSIDRVTWTQQSQLTGYTVLAPFDCKGKVWIRARTTTAAATGSLARVTFHFSRTP